MAIREALKNPRVELSDRMSAAAARNDAGLVQALLDQRADPNFVHPYICSAVPLCRTSDAEVAKVLVAHPSVDVNATDLNRFPVLSNMLLHHRENTGLVSALLAHKDLDVRRGRSLVTGARFAGTQVLSVLLAHPDVDVNDASAGFLHHALARTDDLAMEVVEMLLQCPGLDVNMRLGGEAGGATPLHFLSRRGSLVVDIGESEQGKLRKVAAGQVEMMKLLLARSDLDFSIADDHGATALHEACAAGRADLVEGFLTDERSEASVWQRDTQGRTPLDIAVFESRQQRPMGKPLPPTAKHSDVIHLLSAHQRALLEPLAPPELQRNLKLWDMILDFYV